MFYVLAVSPTVLSPCKLKARTNRPFSFHLPVTFPAELQPLLRRHSSVASEHLEETLILTPNRSPQLGSKALLSKLTQIALSLVFELGLNRAPEYTPLIPIGWPQLTAPSNTPIRSMAERRAVLACFFITSQCVISLQ